MEFSVGDGEILSFADHSGSPKRDCKSDLRNEVVTRTVRRIINFITSGSNFLAKPDIARSNIQFSKHAGFGIRFYANCVRRKAVHFLIGFSTNSHHGASGPIDLLKPRAEMRHFSWMIQRPAVEASLACQGPVWRIFFVLGQDFRG